MAQSVAHLHVVKRFQHRRRLLRYVVLIGAYNLGSNMISIIASTGQVTATDVVYLPEFDFTTYRMVTQIKPLHLRAQAAQYHHC